MDGDASLVMPRLTEQRCNGLARSMLAVRHPQCRGEHCQALMTSTPCSRFESRAAGTLFTQHQVITAAAIERAQG